MVKTKLTILSTLLILSGCTPLALDYQRPDLPVPQQFSISHNTLIEQTGSPDSGWQIFFTDPQLKQMLHIALSENRDLKTATLKVAEAAKQYDITNADRYSQVNMVTNATYSGGLTSKNSTSRQYVIGINSSYQLDFFDKLKNMSEVQQQNFMATKQAQRIAHISIVTQVAQNYLNHVLINQQINISKRSLQNYQRSFQVLEQRYIVGKSTLLDIEQARSLIEASKIEIAKKKGELAQLENGLRLLVGQYELPPITRTKIDNYKIGVALPDNLSSMILLQRPDIAEAEHQLIAANADIGVARAAFFPSISFTGNLTSSNSDLASLFNVASGIWNFIPKIELPIFNGGKNKANLSLAEIRKDLAIVNYEKKIQTAFKEVADALSNRNSLQQQILAQQRYLAILQTTSKRANALYDNGGVDYLAVLDAERALFIAQQNLIELKYQLQINEINLFTALGGGWIE